MLLPNKQFSVVYVSNRLLTSFARPPELSRIACEPRPRPSLRPGPQPEDAAPPRKGVQDSEEGVGACSDGTYAA